MNKLRAIVREVTGATKHGVAGPEASISCPEPSYVMIVEQKGAFHFIRYNSDGEYIADTWHASIDEAKSQAEFEYRIVEEDWSDASERGLDSP